MHLVFSVKGQIPGNDHVKKIQIKPDTIQLDTLSLVPGSLSLMSSNGEAVDTGYYKVNYVTGQLFITKKKADTLSGSTDSIWVSYKTFPFLFSEETKHKDARLIRTDLSGKINPFNYSIENKEDDIFKMEGLNKSGSISRGITFGNNQDVVVNSNLNLQLSGHLSNNVDILMAATDSNIPVQPEGNTQQLQEFDKVFIQLSNANTKLIAGDFQLTRPKSYFMNFNKKAQGISFSTALKTNTEDKNIQKEGLYTTSISAAVSRGKFARNQIQGVESNQGPYRLRGAENEAFIIVLSGTERVYVNGRLMDRGQENDYVINYNTAEITFTSKQLITKDKRIVVEFQYSDKNYARSLVHFGNDYEQERVKLHLNIYSEQDSKNQPLQQDLTTAQKLLLSQIGDTLSLAVSPSYDSVPFTNNEVLYNKKDTTIGTHSYSNVFVYVPGDSSHYRVTFSNVGLNRGNYSQITSSANGKVFQWVMPDTITGTPQGSYEPVIQLVTPKKKQLLTAGLEYQLNRNSKFTIEGAASKNDINTFSRADYKDDDGYAMKLNFDNILPIGADLNDTSENNLKLFTNANYEYVQKYFSPIERYRGIEFERDWNRGNIPVTEDQHVIGAGLGLGKKDIGTVGYRFNALIENTVYNGTRHGVNAKISTKGFNLFYDGSLLNSQGKTNTKFYRHKSGISQNIKWLTVGLSDEFEQNKFMLQKKDSLLLNSYQFWEWKAYMQNADSTKNHYGLYYKQRTDYGVKKAKVITDLVRSTFAEDYGGSLELLKNPNSQLKLNAAYRRLEIINPLITTQKTDNTLVSRVEYDFRLWKGFLYSSSFYEIGSGLEVKKEFSYIEVAAGQGVYTWNDYNGNGVKELNEFEIAAFADQATYIKVYTPTDQYIKTYTNQFSQSLNLKPAALWATKSGIKKFAARFSDQASYRVDRKSTDEDLAKAYNPFLGLVNDSLLNDSTLITINSSFRNTLFINQQSPVIGLDVSYQDVRNKILLVNGFDTRSNIYKEAHLRWNVTQKFFWNLDYKDGIKRSASQYFSSRNYKITYYEAEPKLNYQPNTSFRVSVSFRYTDKKNAAELGGQRAVLQDYGAEVKYNVLQKGSLNLKADYIQITYNGVQVSAIAFEMLDALKVGNNVTWGASYQRTLSNNLQLSITYDGRKSEGSKMVHIGGAQVRAYF
jgi:hypothetical protein